MNVPAGILTAAAGTNGDAVLSWRDPDGFAYAARYAGGWQPAEQLGPTFGEVPIVSQGVYTYSPTAAVVEPDGNIEILYQNDDGSGSCELMAVEHTAASGWSTPAKMQPGVAAPDSFGPHLGLDSMGNTLAVWHYRAPTFDQAMFAVKPHGGAWASPVVITNIEVSATLPFAVSANGTATVLYSPNGDRHLAARTYTPAVGWGAEVSIDLTTGQSDILSDFDETPNFDVAMDSQGHAIAVWPHDSPVNTYDVANTVWSNRTR